MNMDYCKFHNTAMDLNQCSEAIRERLSRTETAKRRELVALCERVLEEIGYFERYDETGGNVDIDRLMDEFEANGLEEDDDDDSD